MGALAVVSPRISAARLPVAVKLIELLGQTALGQTPRSQRAQGLHTMPQGSVLPGALLLMCSTRIEHREQFPHAGDARIIVVDHLPLPLSAVCLVVPPEHSMVAPTCVSWLPGFLGNRQAHRRLDKDSSHHVVLATLGFLDSGDLETSAQDGVIRVGAVQAARGTSRPNGSNALEAISPWRVLPSSERREDAHPDSLSSDSSTIAVVTPPSKCAEFGLCAEEELEATEESNVSDFMDIPSPTTVPPETLQSQSLLPALLPTTPSSLTRAIRGAVLEAADSRHLKETRKGERCDECVEGCRAQFRCLTCSANFCESCHTYHMRAKRSRGHSTLRLDSPRIMVETRDQNCSFVHGGSCKPETTTETGDELATDASSEQDSKEGESILSLPPPTLELMAMRRAAACQEMENVKSEVPSRAGIPEQSLDRSQDTVLHEISGLQLNISGLQEDSSDSVDRLQDSPENHRESHSKSRSGSSSRHPSPRVLTWRPVPPHELATSRRIVHNTTRFPAPATASINSETFSRGFNYFQKLAQAAQTGTRT